MQHPNPNVGQLPIQVEPATARAPKERRRRRVQPFVYTVLNEYEGEFFCGCEPAPAVQARAWSRTSFGDDQGVGSSGPLCAVMSTVEIRWDGTECTAWAVRRRSCRRSSSSCSLVRGWARVGV